jgi:Reverse transcriptase (RNA-dependent DNA polymerase)
LGPTSESPLINDVIINNEEIEIELDGNDINSSISAVICTSMKADNAYDTDPISIHPTPPIDDPDAKDPLTIREAQHLGGMFEEIESLRAKGVYVEVEKLPPGRKAVDSKSVLHIKCKKEGQIVRFKARLVAKGFSQIPGQDFTYTFAPVARFDSIRVLLALVAMYDLELRHIDIKTAYLNGPLEEEIYLKKPEMLGPGYWRLLKGLYGLKQAGRVWYTEFNSKYGKLGFKRCKSDWSVHVRRQGTDKSFSATSVDDILLSSTSIKESNNVIKELGKIFDLTDNGNADWHLTRRITRVRPRRSLMLNQEQYTTSILRDFDMEHCQPATTPCDPNVRLTHDMSKTPQEQAIADSQLYSQCMGKCLFLATECLNNSFTKNYLTNKFVV